MHTTEEEVMRRKRGKWSPIEWSRKYFKFDKIEQEYLQHATFEQIQEIRSDYIRQGIELSIADVMSEQLHSWEQREEYGMCQIIVDTAERYKIDLY